MTVVNLLNIAEGTRTVPNIEGRAYGFPCGTMASIDLDAAYIKLFSAVTAKSGCVIVPPDAELPERFIQLLALLRGVNDLPYQIILEQSKLILGANATRLRPKVNEIRERLRGIAVAYVMAKFTGFDQIMEAEEKRPIDAAPDVLDPDTIGMPQPGVTQSRPNIPRYQREAMERMRNPEAVAAEQMVTDPSSDPRVRERVILGRVPTAVTRTDTPRPVEFVPVIPTGGHAEHMPDARSAEEIAADIEASAGMDDELAIDENETDESEPATSLRPRERARAPKPAAPIAKPVAKKKRVPAKKTKAKKASRR